MVAQRSTSTPADASAHGGSCPCQWLSLGYPRVARRISIVFSVVSTLRNCNLAIFHKMVRAPKSKAAAAPAPAPAPAAAAPAAPVVEAPAKSSPGKKSPAPKAASAKKSPAAKASAKKSPAAKATAADDEDDLEGAVPDFTVVIDDKKFEAALAKVSTPERH